jgi:hypothetical protein
MRVKNKINGEVSRLRIMMNDEKRKKKEYIEDR